MPSLISVPIRQRRALGWLICGPSGVEWISTVPLGFSWVLPVACILPF